MTSNTAQHCGIICLIGEPNVGKSTLLNQLMEQKLAIVTPKAQTTRRAVRGIFVEKQKQLILVDTPGIFQPKKKLDRVMVEEAWQEAESADAVLFLIDAQYGITAKLQPVMERLTTLKKPVIVVLNKVDRTHKPKLLELAYQIQEILKPRHIFMVSARTGDGVKDLLAHLLGLLPKGPWHYLDEAASDMPLREFAAEITRESLLMQLQQELPYELMVETENWQELPPPKKGKQPTIKIHQVITVARESHKKIVLGNKGETIKAVGMKTRQQLEALLRAKIHLELFVKVDPNWQTKRERY
ncbi:MAG: GTPase Era [Rickettsiales bacterium]|nr:GTPase Era [Rickettsiales bacterium]